MRETIRECRLNVQVYDLRWRWLVGEWAEERDAKLRAMGRCHLGPYGNATGATDDAAAEFGLKKSNVSRFRKFYKAVHWSLVVESCEVFGWTWREWRELIYAGGDTKRLYEFVPKDQGTAGVVAWCQTRRRMADVGCP